MGRATLTRIRRVDSVVDAVLEPIARCWCSIAGGHEDIRKVEPQTKRMYLQCMRCLRTTRGVALESTCKSPRPPCVIHASWLATGFELVDSDMAAKDCSTI